MSEQDAADRKAENVIASVANELPNIWLGGRQVHVLKTVVAAALREQANSVYDAFEFTGKQELDGARVEIARLKAALQAARSEIDRLTTAMNKWSEDELLYGGQVPAQNISLQEDLAISKAMIVKLRKAHQAAEQAAERQRTKDAEIATRLGSSDLDSVTALKIATAILAQDVSHEQL